jgi:hypothetical protein
MEDFADNPNTHSVAMADPFLQKIGWASTLTFFKKHR